MTVQLQWQENILECKQRLLQINRKAKFFTCSNHSLNLSGVHTATASVNSVTFFTFFRTVEKAFTFSFQRQLTCATFWKNVFQKLPREYYCCDSLEHDAVLAIRSRYENVTDAVEKLNDHNVNAYTRGEASSTLAAISTFQFFLLSESLGQHLTGSWQHPELPSNTRSWSWLVTRCSWVTAQVTNIQRELSPEHWIRPCILALQWTFQSCVVYARGNKWMMNRLMTLDCRFKMKLGEKWWRQWTSWNTPSTSPTLFIITGRSWNSFYCPTEDKWSRFYKPDANSSVLKHSQNSKHWPTTTGQKHSWSINGLLKPHP